MSSRKDIQPINPDPEVSVLTAVFLLALGAFFFRLAGVEAERPLFER